MHGGGSANKKLLYFFYQEYLHRASYSETLLVKESDWRFLLGGNKFNVTPQISLDFPQCVKV